MGGRWDAFGFQLHKVLWVVLMFHLQANECMSLNLEGLALLRFRKNVNVDPYGAFKNWNPEDSDPCNWSGVHCIDGKVETLNLKELSLGGILAPELGKLSHLKSLVLCKNTFSGIIPKEIGKLTSLELLDLRGNNLSGTLPIEIGEMLSLRHLMICDYNFQGAVLDENLNVLFKTRCNQNLLYNVDTDIVWINRKIGHRILQNGLQPLKKANTFVIPYKWKLLQSLDMLSLFKSKMGFPSLVQKEEHGNDIPSFTEPYIERNVQLIANSARRKLLQETSNLPAAPVSGNLPQEAATVPSIGSGSFPAVPNSNGGNPTESTIPFMPKDLLPNNSNIPDINPDDFKPNKSEGNEPSSNEKFGHVGYFLILTAALLMVLVASMLLTRRHHGATMIRPWRTGLSGQLQKALIAGVPILNRSELEAACEDFSNIIDTFPECTIFKGTLSSGVEIAVASTNIASSKDWSKRSEMRFRKKIDTLSRINHKNFINLLGYCVEDEPFMRMMVLEYAPNGTLFEHLHVKEFEHLDWSARMRIIMGIAYCLQYMHHELSPPIAIPDLQSSTILMTDDYAAKICDCSIWKEVAIRPKSIDEEIDPSGSPFIDVGSNIYSFGILMIEIISGKLPYSEEGGSILNWATEYLNDKRNARNLVDPSLKNFKNNELDAVCEAIQECIHHDPKNRPTMREIATKLREALAISPEAATPRLSPLWWAELEILSVEAS